MKFIVNMQLALLLILKTALVESASDKSPKTDFGHNYPATTENGTHNTLTTELPSNVPDPHVNNQNTKNPATSETKEKKSFGDLFVELINSVCESDAEKKQRREVLDKLRAQEKENLRRKSIDIDGKSKDIDEKLSITAFFLVIFCLALLLWVFNGPDSPFKEHKDVESRYKEPDEHPVHVVHYAINYTLTPQIIQERPEYEYVSNGPFVRPPPKTKALKKSNYPALTYSEDSYSGPIIEEIY